MAEPLDGITVLDWTQWQMGTVAGAMLRDLGATVIHIENRITGDAGRALNPLTWSLPGDRNAYFEVNNRGKKSITVDLTKDKGKELIYRLVKKADVFAMAYRAFDSKVVVDQDQPLDKAVCQSCDVCISLCPVGALIKPEERFKEKKGPPLIVKG